MCSCSARALGVGSKRVFPFFCRPSESRLERTSRCDVWSLLRVRAEWEPTELELAVWDWELGLETRSGQEERKLEANLLLGGQAGGKVPLARRGRGHLEAAHRAKQDRERVIRPRGPANKTDWREGRKERVPDRFSWQLTFDDQKSWEKNGWQWTVGKVFPMYCGRREQQISSLFFLAFFPHSSPCCLTLPAVSDRLSFRSCPSPLGKEGPQHTDDRHLPARRATWYCVRMQLGPRE